MSCYYPRILYSLCPIVQGFSDMYITHVFFRIAGLVVVCPYILLIGIMDSMDAKKKTAAGIFQQCGWMKTIENQNA